MEKLKPLSDEQAKALLNPSDGLLLPGSEGIMILKKGKWELAFTPENYDYESWLRAIGGGAGSHKYKWLKSITEGM